MQAALPFFFFFFFYCRWSPIAGSTVFTSAIRNQYCRHYSANHKRVHPTAILRDGPFLFAFQLLQGQLDGGVTVARRRVDGIKLAQALVQIDRHALVHPKGAHTAGGMTHIGLHLIFQLPNSYSVMAQTRAGRPVAPSMRG